MTNHETAKFFQEFLKNPSLYTEMRSRYYRSPKPKGWFLPSSSVAFVSPVVPEVFDLARTIARDTDPSRPHRIHNRHLFAALLLYEPRSGSTGVRNRLGKEELAVDLLELRGAFLKRSATESLCKFVT